LDPDKKTRKIDLNLYEIYCFPITIVNNLSLKIKNYFEIGNESHSI